MWDSIKCLDSTDKNVFKYVFERKDCVAESVLYKYPEFEDRTVICCSTQSGCPVGCRFCGAGDYFVRSLTADEIVSQPDYLLKDKNIDASKVKKMQIMFMSMGEPMLNYSNLEKALEELYVKYPIARLLISSSGPRVDYHRLNMLSARIPTIGLQFSVHESTDAARDLLIPMKNKLTLDEIASVGRTWAEHAQRKPFFNYCVHDKNDTDADIERLHSLFNPDIWEATISVICERDEHIAAANQRQRALASSFMNRMVGAGFSTRMFDPAGQDDIGGGCGQLWFVQDWMKRNSDLTKKSNGFGLPKVHTPVIEAR